MLAAIPDAGLAARYDKRTRTVASQFAHMHNVRVSQIVGRAKRHLGDLVGYPRGAEPSRDELQASLAASRAAVGDMLAEFEERGSVKSWKGPPASYLGYFVSHESHHRGLVLVSLRLSGVKLGKDVTYGLWGAWSQGTGD